MNYWGHENQARSRKHCTRAADSDTVFIESNNISDRRNIVYDISQLFLQRLRANVTVVARPYLLM